MKNLKYILFLITISTSLWNFTGAQTVNKNEATLIATNWVEQVIDRGSTWGKYTTVTAGQMQVFTDNNRKLGYYCNISPEGFIVVSSRRELAPIKAYSTHGQFDPAINGGITAYLKTTMGRIVNSIESELGPIEQASPEDLIPLLEINYQEYWKAIENNEPGTTIKPPKPDENKSNYQEGQVLLTTDWDQFPPYNAQCPNYGCSTTSNGRAFVGCVATAGAQIMRYWCWPPSGVGVNYSDTYEWASMPSSITTSSPQTQIDAVAELCHEVGTAVSMDYGCNASSSYTDDMEGVFENFYRYSTTCNVIYRSDYAAINWFNVIKAQINANRPVQYRIPGHSIVGDGWNESGSPTLRQYHMNYGWSGTSADMWYTLDALQGGNPADEFIVRDIVPNMALGSYFSGTYPKLSFNHRYFDRDAWGNNATFHSGQWLHFIPKVTVTGHSSTNYIRFYGASNNITYMFTGGDWSKGIQISGGCIRLKNYGAIKLY